MAIEEMAKQILKELHDRLGPQDWLQARDVHRKRHWRDTRMMRIWGPPRFGLDMRGLDRDEAICYLHPRDAICASSRCREVR